MVKVYNLHYYNLHVAPMVQLITLQVSIDISF